MVLDVASPLASVAVALDSLKATTKRIEKDRILVNMFRSLLALEAPTGHIIAACYLVAPEKDSQSGGHRLRQRGGRDLSRQRVLQRTPAHPVLRVQGRRTESPGKEMSKLTHRCCCWCVLH